MPAGEKNKYTKKQIRQAEYIEERYEARGYSAKEAERRAWATVNKLHGVEELPEGSGYGGEEDHEPLHRGGRRGGHPKDAHNRDEMEPE